MSPVSSTPSVRPNLDPKRNAMPARHPGVSKRPAPPSGSVDHWTMVLFYAMGVGALALVALFFVVLLGVGLYGQFVWSFTQWDLSSVRSELLTPWGHFALWVVFMAGMGVGIWFFGGYAWKNVNRRMSNAATRRRR